MIHVVPQAEPASFNSLVRIPGRKFLRKTPKPTAKQFASHSDWREILDVLHDSYAGICAYSCHWIPYDTGNDTVEHFKPKSKYPKLAYEWSNYRLVCGLLNGRKQNQEDVLDPFNVANGQFILIFPSLFVVPAPSLSSATKNKVLKTISRLGLNDEGTCLKSRIKWTTDYCNDDYDFRHLERHAPFIALELKRQKLVAAIKPMMKKARRAPKAKSVVE